MKTAILYALGLMSNINAGMLPIPTTDPSPQFCIMHDETGLYVNVAYDENDGGNILKLVEPNLETNTPWIFRPIQPKGSYGFLETVDGKRLKVLRNDTPDPERFDVSWYEPETVD